jgi:hypothetical protein
MPRFFQTEIAARGRAGTLQNVEFKKRGFSNSAAAEAGTILEIIPVHIKNPPVIQFLAYLDTITDRFESRFETQQPYGRADGYHIWTSNKRSINLTVKLLASSLTAGLDNLNNLSWLLAATYPTYKDRKTATSVAASPLFRVRYGNLIATMSGGGQGMLCMIRNISVTHDIKEGTLAAVPFGMSAGGGNTAGALIKAAGFDNVVREGEKVLIPKLIKLRFTLSVVHDHSMGWDQQTGNWRGSWAAPGYPYKFGLQRDTKDEPSLSESGRISEDVNTSPSDTTSGHAPGSPQAQQSTAGAQTLVTAHGDVIQK